MFIAKTELWHRKEVCIKKKKKDNTDVLITLQQLQLPSVYCDFPV